MHVGSRGGLWNAENIPDLIEREAVLVAQDDGGALVGSKLGQGRLQRATKLLAFDRIGPGRRGRFAGSGREVGRVNRGGLRTRAAHRVDGGVVSDPEQPAGQPPRRIERGEVAEGLDEGFLCQVLGLRPVPRDTRNQADHRPLIPADDLLEGGLRAAQRLDDEPGLAYCFQIDRDGPVLTREYAGPRADVAAPTYETRAFAAAAAERWPADSRIPIPTRFIATTIIVILRANVDTLSTLMIGNTESTM